GVTPSWRKSTGMQADVRLSATSWAPKALWDTYSVAKSSNPSFARGSMLTLYSYPELFGVADNNGYGLKVFAFLRLCSVPFQHEHVFDAASAPRQQLPTSSTMASRSATARSSSLTSSRNIG